MLPLTIVAALAADLERFLDRRAARQRARRAVRFGAGGAAWQLKRATGGPRPPRREV